MISKIGNTFTQNNAYKVTFRSDLQQSTLPKQEDDNKKNKIPSILLGILILGLGSFALVKGKRVKKASSDTFLKEIEQMQIQLKNIFGKDFSKKETEEIARRYIEINKISDNKEFCKTLFEQLKNDFKVENKNLALELMENGIPVNNGVYKGYTEALTRHIGTTYTSSREEIIKNLFHEFRHVKQNELMYRTDPSKLIEIKVLELEKSNNESYKNILRMFKGNKRKARNYIKNNVQQIYHENWGHLTPLSKASEEYYRGLKYLDNEANRIPGGEHYYEQILEKEALFVENSAGKLFEIIKKVLG